MESEKTLQKYAGQIIKKLRERKNMTQDELAEELKITRQAVSRYENGDRGINQDLLFKLASIFNVKIDEFFPPLNNDYKKQEITEAEEKQILKNILIKKGIVNENDEISKEDIDRLLEFTKAGLPFIIKGKK